MTCPHLLAELEAAEARLSLRCAASGGHRVAELWLDDTRRSDPGAVPDALYICHGDPYFEDLLFDVRRRRYYTIACEVWVQAQGGIV